MMIVDLTKVVYIDETSVDSRICRNYARSAKGKRANCPESGNRGKRHTIIGGLMQNKLLSTFRIEGSCNKQIFIEWLKKILLPNLEKGVSLVMDNVAFHKSKEIIELIEANFMKIIFLPPYSPDFNPIEHFWAQKKAKIKTIKLFDSSIALEEIIDIAFSTN